TTTTLADIGGSIVIGPLTLADVQAESLAGSRGVTAYALDASRTEAVGVSASGQSSADHSWNYFDGNGWRTFSNESGGVWTRYFYDGAGNVSKEVRFQRRDAQGSFEGAITDQAERPTLAQLEADYAAAIAAHAAGADTVRVTTRSFDAAHNLLGETEHSTAFGAVSTRRAYDRYNNQVLDVSAVGIAGLENRLATEYDAFNRVVRTETGAFAHLDEAGNAAPAGGAVNSFGYDARGNQSTHLDARGFTERMHYDAYNRLASQWDGQRADSASTLRTDRVYDAFDRLIELRANDLTGRAGQAVQVSTFQWSAFDQQLAHTDALGHRVQRSYDLAGNQTSETDALGNTERYAFDADGHMVQRTDRLGGISSTSYNAYGQRNSETDANGRVTTWTLGAFGQITGSSTGFTNGYARLAGAAASTETMLHDWLGRLTQTSDSFGKQIEYTYDDADHQTRIEDLTNDRAVAYAYDANGQRTSETLTEAGLTTRHQTNHYNSQGWLSGVDADAGFDAGGGAVLGQQLSVAYTFDAAGNRVRIDDGHDDGHYSFDASGRMTRGVDAKRNEVVSQLVYDGYGNRLSETQAGVQTTYTYDAANRVAASSVGEAWAYDANGNTTYTRARNGDTVSTQYNAENRATTTVSSSAGKTTTSTNGYDAVGNVLQTHVQGDGYGFDEITLRDVRYLEQSKTIANSWASGAERLEGSTSFRYDSNGNLTLLDRGRKQGAGENSVAVFEYDLEGHIIGRADKATALTAGDFFAGYPSDPDLAPVYDEYGAGQSVTQQVQSQLFGAGTGATTHLQNYLYANNKSIAQAEGDQVISLHTLRLVGGQAVTDAEQHVVGWQLTLQASDVASTNGQIDRTQTARNIAARAYDGFSALSATAQAKIVAYVQAQLPADAQLTAGTVIDLHGFIQLTDASIANVTQLSDYSLRQLGTDGLPGGNVQSHVVRAGDTLQSIAAMYFGSPSYWYLIADANGLSGSEPLVEGTTLTIPNAVANSVNTADTFKVYNESEIIGSTSPEIRTIQKKKKWWQTLVMIIIVVILIIATIYTAGAASGAWGAAGASAGAAGGAAAAGTAVAGTAVAGTAAATTIGGSIFAAGAALGSSLAAGLGYAGALAVAAGVG
ncbi:MAG TPA: LysM peptidoglycan-binding domain-containing protein, partial [Burkholderiaceae bacterium]|nr:LysM peptidoglycan-binding domain-containing protein [Burkholderiaceae bacterium]